MKLLTVRFLFIALFLSLYPLAAQAGTIQLPATGQTTIYAPGDDGDQPRGTVWPVPRFTENLNLAGVSNGTITDNLTGLIWLKNANCTDTVGGIAKNVSHYAGVGDLVWQQALQWSNALANGACGLSDNSVTGQWRLPNRKELMSLHDLSKNTPPLPTGYPFTAVQGNLYWSSDTWASVTTRAWGVMMGQGALGSNFKTNAFYVLPVRGGL
ncbi:MAG: DUF1566 domain-containing protein [Desulfuromonadaceae bacterium]|nr:DUF1566 domain-containing protein [Desulfuromonadaceae bacterium]